MGVAPMTEEYLLEYLSIICSNYLDVGKRSLMMNFRTGFATNNRDISSSFRDVSTKRHILLC